MRQNHNQLHWCIHGVLNTFVINRKSRMKGDFHARFRENLRVKLPWVTRLYVIKDNTLPAIIRMLKITTTKTNSYSLNS